MKEIQSKYLNTVVKFENPFSYEILEGSVIEEIDHPHKILRVEILYGEHKGDIWEIPVEDVIEDYGFPEETEEKFYRWYDEE